MSYKIEYSTRGNARGRVLWAYHAGTRAEALKSARGLLKDLRLDHRAARVWLDGAPVRPRVVVWPAGIRRGGGVTWPACLRHTE